MTGRLTARRRVSALPSEAGDALVSVVFPAGCRLCEQLLTRARRLPICDDCLASFEPLESPLCEICGQPLEIPSFATGKPPVNLSSTRSGLICSVCEAGTYSFEAARSYAEYEGALVRAIVRLKF